jgi:DNA-directed RNA polymerase subunit RPC12/RpoP
MFYIKIKEAGAKIKIKLRPDNIYTKCANCGREFQVNIFDCNKAALEEMQNIDIFTTGILCPECSDDMDVLENSDPYTIVTGIQA